MANDVSAPISDAAAATFREQAASQGVSAEQIGATLARAGYKPPSNNAPPPAFEPDVAPHTGHPRLNDKQLAQAAETLGRHWTGDPAVLKDALERAGVKPAAPDTRSGEEQAFDRTFGAPASQDEYRLDDLFIGRPTISDDRRVAIASAVRSTLHEMQVPVVLGNGVANALVDAAASGWNAQPSREAQAMYHAQERARACKALNTSWENIMATVKPVVARLSEVNRERWAKSGALESASVLVPLYLHGQRLAVRKGMAKR
jgi:hypothetical protein